MKWCRTTYAVPRLSPSRRLDPIGDTDEWRELQILMREFGQFDAAPPALQMVPQDGSLNRPQGLDAALLPQAVERAEPRRAEPSRGRGEIQIAPWRRAGHLPLTPPKIPVELLHFRRCQRHHEGIPDR